MILEISFLSFSNIDIGFRKLKIFISKTDIITKTLLITS